MPTGQQHLYFEPYAEDTLIGTDVHVNGEEAFNYFSETERVYCRNILLGTIDWAGARKREDGKWEYFKATRDHLDDDGKFFYDTLRTSLKLDHCKQFLVTSINSKPETLKKVVAESQTLNLHVTSIPVHKKPICAVCQKEKPLKSAKRLGWRRLAKAEWYCPEHALVAKISTPQ